MLRSLAFAVALAFASGVAFAENTVPVPNFPDPTEACQNLSVAQAEEIKRPRSQEELFNKCVADEQLGYDTVKQLWPELSQDSAEKCVRFYGSRHYTNRSFPILWHVMAYCVTNLLATQPLPPQTFNKW